MVVQNAGGEEISTYCILDPDYHTPKEIELRRKDAENKKVRLHVWQRKEIENYLMFRPRFKESSVKVVTRHRRKARL